MRVTELLVKDFRGIDEVRLHLSGTEPVVLVGINGSGKSSVLLCCVELLDKLVQQITHPERSGPGLRGCQVREGMAASSYSIEVLHEEVCTKWTIDEIRSRPSERHRQLEMTSLVELAERLRGPLERDPTACIPVLVYYPVNRQVIDTSGVWDQGELNPTPLSGFDGALDRVGVDFQDFFRWFRFREDVENEHRLDDSTHRDYQLEAVRKAIEQIVPGFRRPRVRRNPPHMVITKIDEHSGLETRLLIDQLSDGEKCLIAMVGDLARSLAIANPGLVAPIEGEGVVMVDEIELHLHPQWQRRIVQALTSTFPNCQFILTTHSPLVISEVKTQSVFLLRQTDHGIVAEGPLCSYGQDANRILVELMDVSERPEHVEEEVREYFRLIDEGLVAEARDKRLAIEQLIGTDDPEMAAGRVLEQAAEAAGH